MRARACIPTTIGMDLLLGDAWAHVRGWGQPDHYLPNMPTLTNSLSIQEGGAIAV